MVYVDESGAILESVDLSLGYLEDAEWVDHPEVEEVGHYEYEDLEGGGQLQKYIVDTPYQAAWREVTKQRYIPYTEEELEAMKGIDYGAQIESLRVEVLENRAALEAIAGGVVNA